ncbi:MAG: PspA/IM30 family protein [Thermodesulfobacteriota bacterium]
MSFFSKLWARFKGIFIRAGDDIVAGSPEAIRATYAAAIDEAGRRRQELREAVALLLRERDKIDVLTKTLENEAADLQRRLDGALTKAEAEPDRIEHKEAGVRYLQRIKDIEEKRKKIAGELDFQSKRVEEYKGKLVAFDDEIERLRREQGEMVAEFVSNRQVLQLENRLRGLGESPVDESIVTIRERIGQMKAEVKLATEMSGATVRSQDEAYERAGAEKEARERFDELLKARTASKTPAPEKERDLG